MIMSPEIPPLSDCSSPSLSCVSWTQLLASADWSSKFAKPILPGWTGWRHVSYKVSRRIDSRSYSHDRGDMRWLLAQEISSGKTILMFPTITEANQFAVMNFIRKSHTLPSKYFCWCGNNSINCAISLASCTGECRMLCIAVAVLPALLRFSCRCSFVAP